LFGVVNAFYRANVAAQAAVNALSHIKVNSPFFEESYCMRRAIAKTCLAADAFLGIIENTTPKALACFFRLDEIEDDLVAHFPHF